MTTVTSEADLLSCFRERDRHDVELGPELNLPLEVDGAFAWAVGPRVFLVFSDRPGAHPRGIVFHRNSGGVPDVVSMCEWCHRMRGHGSVRLLGVSVDDRRRVGIYLCSDLGCVTQHEGSLMKIREFAARRIF